jgi:hypothetical protein
LPSIHDVLGLIPSTKNGLCNLNYPPTTGWVNKC